MEVTEKIKFIAKAYKKANKIIMSCENEKHLEVALAYNKNLKLLCNNLKSSDIHESAFLHSVKHNIDSTFSIKRKSLIGY